MKMNSGNANHTNSGVVPQDNVVNFPTQIIRICQSLVGRPEAD
jgi:hypothetical protein